MSDFSVENQRNVSILRDCLRRNHKEDRRQEENIRLYDGTDFGQWMGADTAQLIQDGKYPHTFNLIKKAVDTIVGSVIVDTMDMHFTPEYGEKNNVSLMLNELNIQDSELGGYMDELTQAMRMGFVYRGWIEFYKDRKKDKRGRTGIRYRSGDQIVVDSDWVTKRINDNKQIFLTSWMSAQEIKDRYDVNSDHIETAIKMRAASMGSYGGYGSQKIDKLFDVSPEFYDQLNDLYLVYDMLTLEKSSVQRLFDADSQNFIEGIDEGDMEMFQNAGKVMGRTIEIIEEENLVCKVMTGCPAIALDLELQNGDHPIQIGGYPLVCFSSDAINGRPNTPVDQLKDVQQSINKRETTNTHMLMTMAHDTLLMEMSALENPDTDVERIGKGVRRPGGYFGVADGALSNRRIGYLQRQVPPNNFLDSSNHLQEIAEKLTPAVPATQAVGEGSQSGVLFQSKVAQAQVSMVIPKRNVMAFWQELGNGWFLATRQIVTYPMVLSSPKGEWKLNVPGGVQMKDIPRMRVTITQSPKSETLRRQVLQQFMATSQYCPDPLSKQAFWSQTVSQLPDIPDESLKVISDAADLSFEGAKLQAQLNVMGLQDQLKAAQQARSQNASGQPPAPKGPPIDTVRVNLSLNGDDARDPTTAPLVEKLLQYSNAEPPAAPPAPVPTGQGIAGPPGSPQLHQMPSSALPPKVGTPQSVAAGLAPAPAGGAPAPKSMPNILGGVT